MPRPVTRQSRSWEYFEIAYTLVRAGVFHSGVGTGVSASPVGPRTSQSRAAS